ncbi:hypothetical protein FE257_002777 [Aspergillus nanangensis]|uniref:HIT-type domain-containing protein n=1 Tax=Aspergillus nanangensis TaxID=2582783 RepID=A0AAD4CCL1_ASPNN|nr:hypothetical protein FE257_002777 [Aspergillus nanangensis]
MPGTCEVCASEPSKYRCPTCSLACTQSHKIYCAPQAQSPKLSNELINNHPPHAETNGYGANEAAQKESRNDFNPSALGSSPQINELLEQFPSLGDQLRDIYQATLEEEWVEPQSFGGRSRPFGRGRGGHRNRGHWTREKGYNRGLGKVRKLRERCEEGSETGKGAEGFMRFMGVVNGEHGISPSS